MFTTNIKYPAFIFCMALLVCVQNVWGPSVYILDEAKNATCAREMMESGNPIVPTFNYGLRTDKPPLHYYFMMLSYQIFGVNEFSARFFSSVFGALTVLITFLYTRKWLNEKTAILASVGLISSTHFALQFHLAVPDPYLVFFLTLSAFSFIDGFISQSKLSTYIAYVAIGLGILAKGPIAIGLPGLAVAAFIIFSGRFNWTTIKSFRPFSGLLLSLLIAVPWYVVVGLKTDGKWLVDFFMDHNIDRFAEPSEGHGGKFWLTLIFVIGGMLPFSVYVFQSVAGWWNDRKNDFLFFCGLYALIVAVFFAIADTKLPNYTVPAYPFLAVLIANYLSKVLEKGVASLSFKISSVIILLILIAMPAGLYFGISADKNFAFLADKFWVLIPVSVAGLLGIVYVFKKKTRSTLACIGSGFLILTFVALHIFYPQIDATNPVSQILPLLDTSKPFAHYQRFNPAFSFYLKKPIPKLESSEEVATFFKENPSGILITRSDFADDLSDLEFLKKAYEVQDLFETKETVVFVRKE